MIPTTTDMFHLGLLFALLPECYIQLRLAFVFIRFEHDSDRYITSSAATAYHSRIDNHKATTIITVFMHIPGITFVNVSICVYKAR
jgi:hypothetical protein